jgi:hypothetical protein
MHLHVDLVLCRLLRSCPNPRILPPKLTRSVKHACFRHGCPFYVLACSSFMLPPHQMTKWISLVAAVILIRGASAKDDITASPGSGVYKAVSGSGADRGPTDEEETDAPTDAPTTVISTTTEFVPLNFEGKLAESTVEQVLASVGIVAGTKVFVAVTAFYVPGLVLIFLVSFFSLFRTHGVFPFRLPKMPAHAIASASLGCPCYSALSKALIRATPSRPRAPTSLLRGLCLRALSRVNRLSIISVSHAGPCLLLCIRSRAYCKSPNHLNFPWLVMFVSLKTNVIFHRVNEADCGTLLDDSKQTEIDEALLLVAIALNRVPLSITHFCAEPNAGGAARRRRQTTEPGVVISSETMFAFEDGDDLAAFLAAWATATSTIRITFSARGGAAAEYSVGFSGVIAADFEELVTALEAGTNNGRIVTIAVSSEMQARIVTQSGGIFIPVNSGSSSGKGGKGKGKGKGSKGGGSTQNIVITNGNFFSGGGITIIGGPNFREGDAVATSGKGKSAKATKVGKVRVATAGLAAFVAPVVLLACGLAEAREAGACHA